MPYGQKIIQPENKIDFEAIHKAKVEMMKRFMAAKAEAERQGKVIFMPL